MVVAVVAASVVAVAVPWALTLSWASVLSWSSAVGSLASRLPFSMGKI